MGNKIPSPCSAYGDILTQTITQEPGASPSSIKQATALGKPQESNTQREVKSPFCPSSFPSPAPSSHQVSVRSNVWPMGPHGDVQGCGTRLHRTGFAGHTSPSPALTVFVKKQCNYMKVIEKLPVTNATTKFLFKSSLRRAGNPSAEQQSERAPQCSPARRSRMTRLCRAGGEGQQCNRLNKICLVQKHGTEKEGRKSITRLKRNAINQGCPGLNGDHTAG